MAVLVVVPVVPGLGPLITPVVAAFVAAFATAPFLPGDDATHGQADQGDGGGE
jgi:hypothetical protein